MTARGLELDKVIRDLACFKKRDIEMHNKKETPRAGRGVLCVREDCTRCV